MIVDTNTVVLAIQTCFMWSW